MVANSIKIKILANIHNVAIWLITIFNSCESYKYNFMNSKLE
jgi:hypothetical protein